MYPFSAFNSVFLRANPCFADAASYFVAPGIHGQL